MKPHKLRGRCGLESSNNRHTHTHHLWRCDSIKPVWFLVIQVFSLDLCLHHLFLHWCLSVSLSDIPLWFPIRKWSWPLLGLFLTISYVAPSAILVSILPHSHILFPFSVFLLHICICFLCFNLLLYVCMHVLDCTHAHTQTHTVVSVSASRLQFIIILSALIGCHQDPWYLPFLSQQTAAFSAHRRATHRHIPYPKLDFLLLALSLPFFLLPLFVKGEGERRWWSGQAVYLMEGNGVRPALILSILSFLPSSE